MTRALPVLMIGLIISAGLALTYPDLFLTTSGALLLASLLAVVTLLVLIWPIIQRERRGSQIDDELHLFILRIAVMSLSSSTRTSIFEIASKGMAQGEVFKELDKVKELSRTWKMSVPMALRQIGKQGPSKRLGDFFERMAYAMETEEDPKVFFRNEQEAVMEEYRSKYTNTLDRMEVLREVYISMITVTMFLNVLLAVLSLMVNINHYLMSFLIVFLFIVVEGLLWFVVRSILPRESIWFDPWPYPRSSNFHRRLLVLLLASAMASLIMGSSLIMVGPGWELTIVVLALTTTPFMLPGIYMLVEQNRIVRRDESFGAFMRTIGSTSESKGGSAGMSLKRIRWHDFGQLTEQVRALYDRLRLRLDSDRAWTLFSREARSELISQFLSTYQEGISAGGSPKDVSTMVSGHFTTLQSLRKRRYMMADNFGAILYSLTIFMSASLFMIYAVILEIIDRLSDLGSSSPELETFQSIVLLKDVEGLGGLMLASILVVITLHVLFSADTIRRFKGGHPMTVLLHVPLLFWTAAIAGYAATWAVERVL